MRSLAFVFASTVAAVNPLVHLNYTSYRGTALPNGVTQWLGVRYAAPPLDELRFASPMPPTDAQKGQIVEADAHGPICLSTPGGPPSNSTSEDCLFMDIYAPSNAPTASSKGKKKSLLPVFVFLQGGGYASNANANLNGSGLVTASDLDIVVVNFNYRVGPYGFLAGKEIVAKHAGASLNNGIKDQRQALYWVQEYISAFGGDPGHVTLGGDSAGAQGVNLQVTAYGGRNDGLFHATAAESQSFPSLRTVAESQFMYDGLAIRTGCASASDTLRCLRNLSAAEIQAQNIATPFPGAQQAPLYMYGPTLDFDFIRDYTYNLYAQGKYVKVPAIGGDDTNEGTIFTPRNTSTAGQTDTFLQAQWPGLSLPQLRKFNSFYQSSAYTQYNDSGPYWQALAAGYGEMRYICPGVNISSVQTADSVPNWNYRWNVIDPAAAAIGNGVTHTIEVNAIWGPTNTNGGAPASYYPGGVNFPIVSVVQGYWTSFIRTYNPNTYRVKGSPQWQQWGGGKRRLVFQTGHTAMETVSAAQAMRCQYWATQGPSFGQ